VSAQQRQYLLPKSSLKHDRIRNERLVDGRSRKRIEKFIEEAAARVHFTAEKLPDNKQVAD
jgi:hypothetical protein